MASSTKLSPLSVSSQMAGDKLDAAPAEPDAQYSLHTSVVSVNPGGMLRPSAAISARFAPLPPSSHLRARAKRRRRKNEMSREMMWKLKAQERG